MVTINVLVLCHGNINRSPFCGEILRTFKGLNVVTAGFVNPNKPATKKMRLAAQHYHIDLSQHKSQLVTKEMVEAADLVIYMDGGNWARLKELAGSPHPGQEWMGLGSFAIPPRKKIDDPNFISVQNPKFVEVVELIFNSSMNLGKVLIAKYGSEE